MKITQTEYENLTKSTNELKQNGYGWDEINRYRDFEFNDTIIKVRSRA